MPIKIIFSNSFLKSAKKLPKAQQQKLDRLLTILASQPFAPALHSKSLSQQLAGYYSFRITRDWRVIFQFIDPTTIRLLEVGHRRDIYRT